MSKFQKLPAIKIINVDAEIMGGAPVFAGTRVLMQSFFDYIETGKTVEEFLDGFPSVKRGQVSGLLEVVSRIISTSALFFDESFSSS